MTWHEESEVELTIASTAPESPSDGDYWYDTTNSLLKVYDAGESAWSTDEEHNFVRSAAAPSDPEEGDWWYDTVHSKLKEYNYAWDRCHTVFTYASAAPTTGNLEGDLWYDTANSELKEYAAGWNPETNVNFTFGTTEPENPSDNDLWYDSQNEILMECLNGLWTEISTPITISPSEPTSIASLTELIDPKITISLSAIVRGQNYVSISGTFTNADLASGFKWSETGIIASDENGDEFLYAYCNSGDQYDYIPAGSSGRTITGDLTLLIAVGDAEDVSARIGDGAVYVTRAAFEEHLRATNPHSITKEDVGLGNVENLSAGNLVPVFYDHESSDDFEIGDKLGVIIGRLKTAVQYLNSHINAKHPHKGAAAVSHTHAAGDIVSGTLPVDKGGTGAENAANARINLGVSSIYRRERLETDTINFDSNEYIVSTINIPTITGYSAVAIADWAVTSAGSSSADSLINVNNIELYSSYVKCHLKNTRSSPNACKVKLSILYIKNL